MSKREYVLVIVDKETGDEVFVHDFNFDAGKIKYLPATNKMASVVKKHAAMESEYDPR